MKEESTNGLCLNKSKREFARLRINKKNKQTRTFNVAFKNSLSSLNYKQNTNRRALSEIVVIFVRDLNAHGNRNGQSKRPKEIKQKGFFFLFFYLENIQKP